MGLLIKSRIWIFVALVVVSCKSNISSKGSDSGESTKDKNTSETTETTAETNTDSNTDSETTPDTDTDSETNDQSPTISSIADQVILTNTSTASLSFTIADDLDTLICSQVTKGSSDINLIPLANIVVSGG